MEWKVVIADDEAPAREELAYLLEQIPEVVQVIQAAGGMDAIKKVKEHSPDLLFLDMEMPDLSGLQVAEIIHELSPQIKLIFSTAYDHYAIEAFKLRAFHYILKPYDDNDVFAVFRELRRINESTAAAGAAADVDGSKLQQTCSVKLALEIEGGIKYISPKDIIYISKEGKHVQVHTREQAYEVVYTLQDLEQKLESYGLFRCHKSYLIQMDAILELKSWVNGAYNVTMDDKQQSVIPVSRNYVKDLRLKLEI
ncbi:LytR/AlgR family response regulator transcription factor [Paenibacillus rigui]|uniref:DNA-binding response regulator n=1 Tax=Paenibacillus rigui TaxID=554312 RepID=A0A229ULB7_9BACL|nr:LytTR family DNA-binding domain-containing protein [Paenibacillus rigui]OXM84206.1 DNA-binding response regulator [Paenibacillus rigui]